MKDQPSEHDQPEAVSMNQDSNGTFVPTNDQQVYAQSDWEGVDATAFVEPTA